MATYAAMAQMYASMIDNGMRVQMLGPHAQGPTTAPVMMEDPIRVDSPRTAYRHPHLERGKSISMSPKGFGRQGYLATPLLSGDEGEAVVRYS